MASFTVQCVLPNDAPGWAKGLEGQTINLPLVASDDGQYLNNGEKGKGRRMSNIGAFDVSFGIRRAEAKGKGTQTVGLTEADRTSLRKKAVAMLDANVAESDVRGWLVQTQDTMLRADASLSGAALRFALAS